MKLLNASRWRWSVLACPMILLLGSVVLCAKEPQTQSGVAKPAATSPTVLPDTVGERVPSEDSVVKNLHSLGLVSGHTNIFRSACPVRELAKSTDKDDRSKLAEAEATMRHLQKLGVRTIISFEDPYHYDADDKPKGTTAS